MLLRFQHFRKNIQLQHYSCCQRRNQCKRNAADFRTGRNESVLKQTEKNHRKADGNRQRGYFSELCLAGSLGRELADPAYSKADSKNAERREQFAHEHTQIKVVFEKAVIQQSERAQNVYAQKLSGKHCEYMDGIHQQSQRNPSLVHEYDCHKICRQLDNRYIYSVFMRNKRQPCT